MGCPATRNAIRLEGTKKQLTLVGRGFGELHCKCRFGRTAVGRGVRCSWERSLHIIRKAIRSDAAALSWFAERTFREAFGAANTAGNMDAHCRGSYSEDVQAREIACANRVTLLAEHGEEIVGFAQLRWGKAPKCVQGNSPGEIQRLYVASTWQGMGVAQTLMAACLEELRLRGSDAAWLGVWERNPRAIAFYRKSGFAERGDQIFPLGHDPQRDIVMARWL
jgi:ribosomal protein S18 acetylase RimI-like enzyme